MKLIKLLILPLCLLLTMAVLVACNQDKAPADSTDTGDNTTAMATEAPGGTEAVPGTEATTVADTAAVPDTDTDTDAVTDRPEETTEFEPPVADPTEAAAIGLPLDADSYALGEEGSTADTAAQYAYLVTYAHAYADKSFTLWGNLSEDEHGNTLLSLGEGLDLTVYYDGTVTEPVIGSYVKITATWTQLIDRGEYVDFGCFTMVVTASETLGEAVGPNGGRYMFVTATALNVRTSSDISSSDNILGQLSYGDMVEVFEQDEKGWYRITFKGQTAYISNKYVSETKP